MSENIATDGHIAYECIKYYPGCKHSLGDIVLRTEIPGHQWPEFYRCVYRMEYELYTRKKSLLQQIRDIDSEIENIKKSS